MRFYQDLRTDRLIEKPGIESDLTEVAFKHTVSQAIELQYGETADESSDFLLDPGGSNWTKKWLTRGESTTFTADPSTDLLTVDDVTAAKLADTHRVIVEASGAAGSGATFTADDTTDVLTLSDGAEVEDGDRVLLTTSASDLPAGLEPGVTYYVRDKSGATCKLATTYNGSAIDITDTGSGTHTLTRQAAIVPAPLDANTVYYVRDLSGSTLKLAATSGGSAIDLTDIGTGSGTLTIYDVEAEIWVGLKRDDEFDSEPLAVAKTFTIDVANHLYEFDLDLATSAIRTLLGRGDPGDGTTFTADAGTDLLTLTTIAEVSDGDRVLLTTTDTLPDPLATGTEYYVRDLSGSTIKLATSAGGTAIDLTDAGTGTHTITRQPATSDDVAKVEDLEFEFIYRRDPDESDWRPSANVVAATLHNSVFDGLEGSPNSAVFGAGSFLSGTGTLSDTNSTAAVSWGETLSSTPDLSQLILTIEFTDRKTDVWPSSLSTTGFTLNAEASAHGGINYGWQLRR